MTTHFDNVVETDDEILEANIAITQMLIDKVASFKNIADRIEFLAINDDLQIAYADYGVATEATVAVSSFSNYIWYRLVKPGLDAELRSLTKGLRVKKYSTPIPTKTRWITSYVTDLATA